MGLRISRFQAIRNEDEYYCSRCSTILFHVHFSCIASRELNNRCNYRADGQQMLAVLASKVNVCGMQHAAGPLCFRISPGLRTAGIAITIIFGRWCSAQVLAVPLTLHMRTTFGVYILMDRWLALDVSTEKGLLMRSARRGIFLGWHSGICIHVLRRFTYSTSKAGVLLNIPAGRVTRSLRFRFLGEHTKTVVTTNERISSKGVLALEPLLSYQLCIVCYSCTQRLCRDSRRFLAYNVSAELVRRLLLLVVFHCIESGRYNH